MPRLEGDVFFFGTAMVAISLNTAARRAPDRQNLREAGLIEEAPRQG
jgi:hypothetical protein